MKNKQLFIVLILSFVSYHILGQNIEQLKSYDEHSQSTDKDWLIDNTSFTSNVYRSQDNKYIILSNGLINRTFKVSPNLATVGFKNLINQRPMLRSVRPEALVTINGVKFEVGGLKGQDNQAFILPKWLDDMKDDPAAFHYTGFTVGKIDKRLEWKKVRHYDESTNWPPKGVSLRLNFELPKVNATYLESLLNPLDVNEGKYQDNRVAIPSQSSDIGRKQLLQDNFSSLSDQWVVHTSASHERSSFVNEGKIGEIYTPANSSVYIERELSEDVKLVEATFHIGTDNSSDYGPGITLVYENGTSLKFYIRPEANTYDKLPMLGLYDGKRTHSRIGGRVPLDKSKPWTLRIREEKGRLFFDARIKGGEWKNYHSMALSPAKGRPVKVRLGKTNEKGEGTDAKETGELVRLHVTHFAAYSAIDKQGLEQAIHKIEKLKKVNIAVIYDLYDGIPLISKRIEIKNNTDQTITIDRFTSEILAMIEHSSRTFYKEKIGIPKPDMLHVETDYAFRGLTYENANSHVVNWKEDLLYTSQVHNFRKTPNLLVVEPTVGPSQDIKSGEIFKSFTTFELAHESSDRERRGLELKQMYRTISPWVTENPLMMHSRSSKLEDVRTAIDQCAEVGFEMLILSFGSGFDMENDTPEYIQQWKEIADYAKSKNVEIGGYSLLASRRVGNGNDVVSPKGTTPAFGSAPSLTSKWGIDYYNKIYNFYNKTGFSLLEHDGPYVGDIDITPRLPYQKGELDSRWVQWRLTDKLYKWCRSKGIYLNTPDWYYHSGSNKCTMGYREANWSLPREQQVLHTRQNIYDGSWNMTPTMGWMFVPLTEYHGGGAEATIEPLNEHLDHYKKMLLSNLSMGVQACYRGPRLYDSEETKSMVKEQIDWFKKYREILESNMIHGVRANGENIDWMMHVNPNLKEKGLVTFFNPTDKTIKKNIKLPLYYTGLKSKATIREKEGVSKTYKLDRGYDVEIEVEVPAMGSTWFVIQ